MESSTKRALGIAAAALGVAAVVTGAVIYGRSKTKNGLGRAATRVHGRQAAPPVRGRTRGSNGRMLSEYSQASLPINQRIGIIQEKTALSVKDPAMRHLALAITGNGGTVQVGSRTVHVQGARCEARDKVCEARAIYEWVRDHIRYTGDVGPHRLLSGKVEPVDLFQSAAATVEMQGGDCDDHTIAVNTLGILNGHEMRDRVYSPNAGPQDDFAHIGAGSVIRGKFYAMDSTLPGRYFGVEAPAKKVKEFIA